VLLLFFSKTATSFAEDQPWGLLSALKDEPSVNGRW
jgi:hypothetical protein